MLVIEISTVLVCESVRDWLGRDTAAFSKDVIVRYFGKGVGYTSIAFVKIMQLYT